MSRLIGIALLSLFTLAAAPEASSAQEFGPECFRCDNAYFNDQEWHEDERRPWEAGLLGEFHSQWILYSCEVHLDEGYHQNYGNLSFAERGDFTDAIEDGSDAAVLKALLEHQTIKLNVARSALQLTEPYGNRVRYHTPLDPAQVDRLQTALTLASVSAGTQAATRAESTRSRLE